jgi:hypothetical protein
MTAGGKTIMISGYLPDALRADGTLEDEHRCPLCPPPGEGITIDLEDPGHLDELRRLFTRPPPPARGRSRGKRRRKRR